MGFRASFLKHQGYVTSHSEIFLNVLDRFAPLTPVNVLLIGVDNGGSLQVWREMLPEGSTVVGVDERQECAELGLGVHVGKVCDRVWLEKTLGSTMFDLIIDSMGHADGSVWPWLKVKGLFVVEHYDPQRVQHLMAAVANDCPTWLPFEEVFGVQYYPQVVLVEKRDPRVVPYLDIIVGQDGPVVDEQVYAERGGKRVTVSKEVLENI